MTIYIIFSVLILIVLISIIFSLRVKHKNIGFVITSSVLILADIFSMHIISADTIKEARNYLLMYYLVYPWLFDLYGSVVSYRFMLFQERSYKLFTSHSVRPHMVGREDAFSSVFSQHIHCVLRSLPDKLHHYIFNDACICIKCSRSVQGQIYQSHDPTGNHVRSYFLYIY